MVTSSLCIRIKTKTRVNAAGSCSVGGEAAGCRPGRSHHHHMATAVATWQLEIVKLAAAEAVAMATWQQDWQYDGNVQYVQSQHDEGCCTMEMRVVTP